MLLITAGPLFTGHFTGSKVVVGKSSLHRSGWAGVVPVPFRSTVAVGWFEALLVTVRIPLLTPTEEGLNDIVLFMLVPPAT